jgi:dTMP kinase
VGKLFVIDGLDGCGKSTQFDLLGEAMERQGGFYRTISFPDYSQPSSALVKMYLGGDLGGSPAAVNAYAASSFDAVDRYASYKCFWEKDYADGATIIAARYTTSNAVHQASKEEGENQIAFLHWLYDFEYNKMGLPRPDLVIYLDVPTDFTEKLMRTREAITNTKADIHEQDMAYLATCRRTGRTAAEYYGWKIVTCVEDGRMRSIEDIHNEIYGLVAACLEE